MDNFGVEFWVQIGAYLSTFGYMYGSLKTEMKWMKEKLDRHNSFQDRLTKVESKNDALHNRVDECSDMVNECFKRRA